jgi:hypothetical protein
VDGEDLGEEWIYQKGGCVNNRNDKNDKNDKITCPYCKSDMESCPEYDFWLPGDFHFTCSNCMEGEAIGLIEIEDKREEERDAKISNL